MIADANGYDLNDRCVASIHTSGEKRSQEDKDLDGGPGRIRTYDQWIMSPLL